MIRYVSLVGLLLSASAVRAGVLPLPAGLPREILSEDVPLAFSAAPFLAEDFAVEWAGEALPGVRAEIVPRTRQWVRVAEVLVLPRARLAVTADGVEDGRVTSGGASQPLVVERATGRVEIPIALVSGDANPIHVVVRRAGRASFGRLVVRFRPRPSAGPGRVFYDPSCSRFALDSQASLPPAGQWLYVGCRQMILRAAEGEAGGLEALVYWDGAGDVVRVGGVDSAPGAAPVWLLALRSAPGRIDLEAPDARVTLSWRMAPRFHRAFVGLGLGPYARRYEIDGGGTETVTPLLTVYGAYFITDAVRLVLFDAASLDRHPYTDLGLYLYTESFRFLDRRVGFNLLLGAHVLAIRPRDEWLWRLSGPQGVELVFTDFGRRGWSLTAGGFLYPPVDVRAYYNLWLRYGTARAFFEVNYIEFTESVGAGALRSRSAGLSIGLPVLRFL